MKRAIVTGCSRGIGRAVTEMLLAEGWRVLGVSRSMPSFEHPQFFWERANIGSAFSSLQSSGDPVSVDALIHCAAIRGPYGTLDTVDDDEWMEAVNVNLLGTYRVVRAALPLLKRSEDGRILLFSGGGAFDPSPGFSAYAVAKAGVVSFMETLAEELAGTTVTANCVAPGFVATDIHRGTPHEGKDDGGDAMDKAVACVRHLLSPSARGLTGKTISAQWDDWANLTPWVVDALNDSNMGTRSRQPVAMLGHLAARVLRAV